MSRIAIVDSGSGNLRSVAKAITAAGGTPVVTSDPTQIRQADKVLVPGQGAFSEAMRRLGERGLDTALREVIQAGTPYFGICLGLQLLFEHSEEGDTQGLGVLGGEVIRFSPSVVDVAGNVAGNVARKVPHIGWNQVTRVQDLPILQGIESGTFFYFIHSYYVQPTEQSMIALTCEYVAPFTAAIAVDNIFACQFHPEKSHDAGFRLLENFVNL